METQFMENKLIGLYMEIDDLPKACKNYLTTKGSPVKELDTQLSA